MIRTKLYIRVDCDLADQREMRKVAGEIERALKKMYGVRSVEITHTSSEEAPDEAEEL